MNARVKRLRPAPAQNAVDGDSDWIVVRKLKKRPIVEDGRCTGWVRRVIVDRKNKDLPDQPEAASEHGETLASSQR